MQHLHLMTLLAGSAAIAGCAAAPPPPAVAVAAGQVCATGSIDADGDGAVTAAIGSTLLRSQGSNRPWQ